ncbi:gliding motility-associated C-terminal domain-containing protein [Hymenobacter gummosus]|uniref:Gliding motility-associated C-terminal domain-containing protein n=1 Tax=Hymenobacter gummosus TaxID=1776032 RepID=A0A3S0HRB9_9BACT|nr:gliding motility-associated C-terminal domain-containing protein [Hymenobacter gummosus]RTQ53358.1 gliding motility-associated C-terminal domain-containing protein [Hymenobacter gummosus]
MKHLLRASLLLFSAWCLALAGVQQAYASHAQGGQLTYEFLRVVPATATAPEKQRYRVTARYFRDCSGITAETSLTLNCRVGTPATSCTVNDPRNPAPVTLVRGTPSIGTPYCNSQASLNVCVSGSQNPNYEVASYVGEVELEYAPEWTMSVEISARPSIENIGGNTTLRFEATLNNQIALASGTQSRQQNNSPQYSNLDTPVPFVCVNQRTSLTFSTFEPDGDSLVYNLDRPLEGCNNFSTYINSPSGTPIVLSTNPPCIFQPPTATIPYSATYPISSYNTNGVCSPTNALVTGTPYFNFDPSSGGFTFTPSIFYPGTPSSAGRNKYAVVGKVTEFRLINGRYYKVGSVRRDMLVIVIDCGGNTVPSAPIAQPVTAGNNTQIVNTDSTIVTAQACEYTEVNVNFRDPNPGDQLTVTYALPTDPYYADLFDGTAANVFTLTNNGQTAPVGRLRLRPDPLLTNKTFRIQVRVEDNACPIKAVQNRIIVIRVTRRSVADVTIGGTNPAPGTAIKRDSLITIGDAIDLVARANRPAVIGTSPVTYTYTWRASTPDDISDLDATKKTQQSITVTPKQNTRYFVSIAPSGFRAGACVDTASFVIRLAPKVPNVFTPNGDGKNDFFVIKESSQPSRRLEVFNRWGRKIGDWADYKNDWDGKGQADGVYYYQITLADGTRQKGWVEIMR